jgi:hypothetical protein
LYKILRIRFISFTDIKVHINEEIILSKPINMYFFKKLNPDIDIILKIINNIAKLNDAINEALFIPK